jgi:hypothetical protein
LADLFVLFQNEPYGVARDELNLRYRTLSATIEKRYPQYSWILSLDGIIDILYGVGFLGVRRRNSVSYSYIDDIRVEPEENEFYVHPCFRRALGAVAATAVDPYQPSDSARLWDRHRRGIARRSGGAVRVREDPASRLINAISLSVSKIDPQVSTVFPEVAWSAIRKDLKKIVSDNNTVADSLPEEPDLAMDQVLDHATAVLTYLESFAAELRRGLGKPDESSLLRSIDDAITRISAEYYGPDQSVS